MDMPVIGWSNDAAVHSGRRTTDRMSLERIQAEHILRAVGFT